MTVAALIIAAYLAFNGLIFAAQRSMMYLPSVERVEPREVGLSDVDEVPLRASQFELISWFGRPAPGRPTILLFHGNAGALYHRAYRFHEWMAAGYGVFVLGYPGYGGNPGTPSEASLVEASELAYEYLRDAGISASEIIIYGESIGSGVAVQLAARVDAKALILEAPMSSATDVARHHYPIMLASFFVLDSFRSVDYIANIDMPLLVMHGARDRIIPVALGERLVEHAAEPKTMVVVEGAGHNDLSQFPTHQIAREFLESL